MLLLSGLEQLPPQAGPFPKPHWVVGVLVAALAGGGRGESLAVLACHPSSSSRLPGPLSTCVQCLILAFLFSALALLGFLPWPSLASPRIASGSCPLGGAGLLVRPPLSFLWGVAGGRD